MNEELAPNVRYAEVRYGDDLRKIALRELGDASAWLDLVVLNRLRPPYIARLPGNGVLAYGDRIAIPASISIVSADTDEAAVYGTDIRLFNRRIGVDAGDIALVSGLPNLRQALTLRVMVGKRELMFHPTFGCYVRSLLGRVTGPTAAQLAAFYVKSALLEDDRVDTVPSCIAEVVGDQVKVSVKVVPITGKPVELGVLI